MKWSRKSAYSIQSGEFVICKTTHSGVDRYTLWRGFQGVSEHSTASEAKARAKRESAA